MSPNGPSHTVPAHVEQGLGACAAARPSNRRDRRRAGGGGVTGDDGSEYLVEFCLEMGQPIWRYDLGTAVIEKQVLMPHLQNTVYVMYRLVSGDERVRLTLRPYVHFRPHDASVEAPLEGPYALHVVGDRYELSAPGGLPPLRLAVRGEAAAFATQAKLVRQLPYIVEQTRGYGHLGEIWSPGYFRIDLTLSRSVTLIASTED